jgi:hypothetical protein
MLFTINVHIFHVFLVLSSQICFILLKQKIVLPNYFYIKYVCVTKEILFNNGFTLDIRKTKITMSLQRASYATLY